MKQKTALGEIMLLPATTSYKQLQPATKG